MKLKQRKTRGRHQTNTQNKPVFFKVLILSSAIGLTGASGAALIVDGGWGTAAAITAGLQAAKKAIIEQATKVMDGFQLQMQSMDLAVAGAMQFENEQISSAMRVLVKQMSVSANMLAENTVKSAQSEAAVEQARIQKDKIIETNEKLGPQGQGHKVCTVLAERTIASKVASSNSKNVPTLVSSTVYASPGSYADPNKIQKEILADHATNYCTDEQAASGYCAAASDMPGWNLQMSTLFTPTTENSPVFDAQNSLINNMIGLPDSPIPTALKGSPNASNYLVMKQKKDAIVSPAINSLKSIQAEFSGLKNPDSSIQISPVKAVDEQVKRYLGSGDEYQSWNQTLVKGSEEGIMKELLQVQALDLYLHARQYKQYEREELLLAGIVSATQQLVDKRSPKVSGTTVSLTPEREKDRLEARSMMEAYYKNKR